MEDFIHETYQLDLYNKGIKRTFLSPRLLQIIIIEKKDLKPIAVINDTSVQAAQGYQIVSVVSTTQAKKSYKMVQIKD